MVPDKLSIKYLTDVKRSMLIKGYWGESVKKLLDELSDHFLAKIEQLKSEGHGATEAQEMTEEALGDPQVIASEWASVLRSRNWLCRHPGVSAILGFISVWCLDILIIMIFFHHGSTVQLSVELLIVNWMPWVMGMAFLIWKAIRAPIGWGPLLWWCVILGLATSAWDFQGTINPKSGHTLLFIYGRTWTSLWDYPLCWFLNVLSCIEADRPGFWISAWQCPNLFKLLFPPLACWVARWYFTAAGKLNATPAAT